MAGALPPEPYVLVIGSANVDVSVSTPRLPQPGETLFGDSALISTGGKGANQAVAAARCGARTLLLGRVGADAFGTLVRESLVDAGVDTRELKISPAATGLAAICVDAAGQNCIVVVPGANLALQPGDIDAARALLQAAACIVLQCEIPMPSVYRCIELAAQSGTPVLLNPAPYRGLDLARIGRGVTYLVPNETEAAQIDGRPLDSDAALMDCAQQLRRHGVDCVILTLGARGCLIADAGGPRWLPALDVVAVDATGAGDAFVGCLAASLAAGHARDVAVRRALAYASVSTTRRGAQASYPEAAELQAAWSAIGPATAPGG